MGNCFVQLRGRDSSSQPSKVVASRTSLSSVPSSLTTSTASTLGEKTHSWRTEDEILLASSSKAFTLNELKSATRNFRPESLIGEGGFGCVYKGWLDERTLTATRPGNGMVVAVKKLKLESFQGHKEWLTEVNYLDQLQHPNLVKLIGYCSEGENRLLVYEYMAKGSLENHLRFDLLSRKCSAARLGDENQSRSRCGKGTLVFAQSRVSSNISRC